jgi:hypothetical protein
LTPAATAAEKKLNATIASMDAQITSLEGHLDWLNRTLEANESEATLTGLRNTAMSTRDAARTNELDKKNEAFKRELLRVPPATMPAIVTDDRDLVTTGAVLDFAQPAGGVRLRESCEGNVLLTYFDTLGRMRVTAYDAAADSRNAAFEQWVPDAVRACVEIQNELAAITLPQPMTLPANGATCEAWVHYPVPAKPQGIAYDVNAVACAAMTLDAPLVVRNGNRLGIFVDGWFFDSGANLDRTLNVGWHHLAASTLRSTTSFYADGMKLGSRKTVQPALRFNGSSDFVEVPPRASPTAAMTVSVWARAATTSSPGPGCLVSKSLFALELDDAANVSFSCVTNKQDLIGTIVRAVAGPISVRDWHFYTATFDGSYVRLYVDGVLKDQKPTLGPLVSSSTVMLVGADVRSTVLKGWFNGDIAEVSYWNTARTREEIMEEYYQSLKGDEDGLIGFWRMEKVDGGASSTVKDLTSKAGNGVVKGEPTDATITTLRERSVAILGNTFTRNGPIGRVSEVRLWNVGLTEAEVAVNARTAISGSEPGLIGYWPLDEGAGTTAYDRSYGGQAHGTQETTTYVGCTANMGNPGSRVLRLPNRGDSHVECSSIPISNKSFTFECWARRSGAGMGGGFQLIAGMGTAGMNTGFHFGFRPTNKFTMGFYSNDVDSALAYTDTDWHHWCGTYDKTTETQRLYCDGILVGERTLSKSLNAPGPLKIGACPFVTDGRFRGEIAEVRIWDKARSEAEIRQTMRRRLVGNEANLIAYYPFDEAPTEGKVKDKKTGTLNGQLNGPAELLCTTALPMAGADSLVTCEYSSIEVSAEGRKQALMRRFYAHTSGGDVQLVPEKRVEELTLQWVGNTQINPSLLGYIEGAPPIPSENLTVAEDYDGATTVTLTQSDETTYSWQRSETSGFGIKYEGFLGGAWEVSAGVGVEDKLSEGEAGATFQTEFSKMDTNDSSISALSTLATTDSLTLTGMFEDTISCPALGKRWMPKNVGYALVISGTADVFVTKLKRSGRMVSYDIRPVEGVPLDVNTITFMLNPAYVMNGSLDGMVGSMPADPTFYPHVPEMRAQYGSRYPASYFRLADAYKLKAEIERQDKDRETFFYNTKADEVDKIESAGTKAALPNVSSTNTTVAAGNDPNALNKKNEAEKKAQKDDAEKRQAEIESRNKSVEGRVRAGEAFADWQRRMEKILTKSRKRNIVNTYVWDGDGGLRAEEQSFAGTIEHSVSTASNYTGGGGADVDAMFAHFKFKLTIEGTGTYDNVMGRKLSFSKSLALNVDLSGVEKNGITDLRDNPVVPGEKVDRYRFMTFYLENSSENFDDFFSYVVDPEWLMSNDEEARALRQARSLPNPCWRVLHRVTYVERPVLMSVGKELRTLSSQKEDETMRGFKSVTSRIEELDRSLSAQLTAIRTKLPP